MVYDPEQAQAAAREQLRGVAAGVAGEDVAGVYGDPAGAAVRDAPQSQEQIASGLAAAGGTAASADVEALIAAVQAQAEQLRALQEQIDARIEAEKTAEARAPSLTEALASFSGSAQVAHLFQIVEERLAALEGLPVAVADGLGGGSRSVRMITVAVSAEMVYQLVGSNMSSPQTAELNAPARAPTIQKWVTLTNAEAVGWIVFLCLLDGSLWPVVGGGLALGGMVLKYRYAINSGLGSRGAATEDYATMGNNPT